MQHDMTCRLVPAILLCVLLPGSSLAWQARAAYQDKSAAHWVGQLSQPEKQTRRLAAYALGRIAPQDKIAVAALVKAIVDDDIDVARYSIYALGRIGPAAKIAALQLAKVIEVEQQAEVNDYKFYRRGAVRALGDIEADDARSRSLLAAALKDKDLVLRVDAALALLKLDRSMKRAPNSAAVRTLDSALSGSDAQARYRATAGLAQLGAAAKPLDAALLRALRSADADARRGAARAIGAIGYEMIGRLAAMANDANPRTRASVVSALGWCGEVTNRRELSGSTAPAERIAAAETAIRDVAVPALAERLGDPDESIRRASAVALARIGPLALPILVQSLRADSSRVRRGAGRALDALAPSLPSRSSDEPAMQAIRSAVLPGVVAAIEHEDVEVRYRAVRLFYMLAFDRKAVATTDAQQRLRKALKDPDSRVRGYASRALRQLQSTSK